MDSYIIKRLAKPIILLLTPSLIIAAPFSEGQNHTLAAHTRRPFNLTSSDWNNTYYHNSTSARNATLVRPTGSALYTASVGQSYTSVSSSALATASSSVQYSHMSLPALVPDVHWSQPVDDIRNLAPSHNQSFYYSSNGAANPTEEHTFAYVHSNTSHPTAVLAHSKYIQGVTCNANGIHISCKDKESLTFIESTWSASMPMIIVTFAEGCGDSKDQRSFWLVNEIRTEPTDSSDGNRSRSSFSSSGNVILATVQRQLSIGEAMPEVELSWGTYRPNNNTVNPTTRKPNLQVTPGHYGKYGNYTMGNGTNATNGTHTFNGTIAINSTNTTNSPNVLCGAPPSRKIDGFFTAACGSPTFDQDIDDAIGFSDFDPSHFSTSLKDFAPGVDNDSAADNQVFGPTKKKREEFQRRDFLGIGKAFNDIKEHVSNVVTKVGQDIASATQKVGEAISDASALTPSASANIPIDVASPDLIDSPFGKAIQILSKQEESKDGRASANIDLFCVDCFIKGNVHLAGSARFTIKDGLTQLNADVKGNIAAGLSIGIDAHAEISSTFKHPIAPRAGLPGFSVPGLFAVGPFVSLDAEIELGLTLAGKVLAGVKMNIPDFSANLDLQDTSKSVSTGFTPQFEKIFKAEAAITAQASLGLPLGLEIGVDITPIKFTKSAALVEKPSIEAMIALTGSSSGESANGDNTCVNGLSAGLKFTNNIFADFFGVTKVDLNKFEVPIASTCVLLAATPTTAVSSEQPTADQTGTTTSEMTSATTPIDTVPTPEQPTQRRATLRFSRSVKRPILTRQNKGKAGQNGTDSPSDPFSFVDSDDPDEPADNSEFEDLSKAALAEADSELKVDNSTLVNINDAVNTFSLAADPVTGNVLIGDPGDGTPFITAEDNVVGDDSGRYFHYYPDLMNAYNVSRFRLSTEAQIPKDSQLVALVPVDHDNSTQTPRIYAALDTTGNAFLTITCDIEGEFSKVFLVQDAEEGIKKLMDRRLRFTVTGGIVTNCYYLPFVEPPKSSNATIVK